MKRVTGNRIVDLSFDLALQVIAFSERLESEPQANMPYLPATVISKAVKVLAHARCWQVR